MFLSTINLIFFFVMLYKVVVSCILAIASSGVIDPKYTIYDNGPNGMHVQMGEPGKAVSGYYT